MLGSRRFTIFTLVFAGLTACASSSHLQDLAPAQEPLPINLESKFAVIESGTGKSTLPSPVDAPPAKKTARKNKPKLPPPFAFPNRRVPFEPIWMGERQVLEFTYLGVKAGDFTLFVLPWKEIAGRKVYHLQARAVSSTLLELFYRLNDTIESFWDYEGLFSHRFHMVLDQTKQKRDALELFDSETKKDFYWNRRNHSEKGNSESKETFDIPAFPQDSFSALYYVRTLPLEVGQVYTFPIVSEGRSWDAIITVMRREKLNTPLGPKMCIVVRPQTRYQGVMQQQKGESLIWLTDDDRRFIVRVEAEVKVGSVTAKLKAIEPGEKPHVD